MYSCGQMKTKVFENDYVTVWGPVYPAHEIRHQHFVGSPTTTSFICMTILVERVLQKLFFIEGLKFHHRTITLLFGYNLSRRSTQAEIYLMNCIL